MARLLVSHACTAALEAIPRPRLPKMPLGWRPPRWPLGPILDNLDMNLPRLGPPDVPTLTELRGIARAPGPAAAKRDPADKVREALALLILHEHLREDWSVTSIMKEVGASRTLAYSRAWEPFLAACWAARGNLPAGQKVAGMVEAIDPDSAAG